MTREEAKAWFKVLLKDEYAFNSADREAFAMAIKALEQEPCDVFDEYGNYKYPSDVKLTEPNTATSMPCEDAINREDALMCLTGEWTEITDEIIHRFIKRIKALPPVNPQSKWIPVSKRLPELNKPLLVTTYHRVYYGHLISESDNYGYPVFRIHGLGDKNRDWVQETMSHEPYSLRRIDAWMYLDIPEPYKVSEIPTGSDPQESEKVN